MDALPDSVRAAAFATASGDSVVAVLVNIGKTAKPLSINGMSGYDLSEICLSVQGGQKSASNRPSEIISAAEIPAAIPAQLPARSIATIVWVNNKTSVTRDKLASASTAARPSITVRGKTLNVSSPDNAEMRIRVVDLSGRTVAGFNAKGNANLSLKKIPAGAYIIEAKRVKDGMKITSNAVLR
jgi:hypothetical protein